MKKTALNLLSSIIVTFTNIAIGFWLSPFIISHIGIEANGYIALAQNFITYASLIVTALNSMAARFITIEYVKKDIRKANIYYNSVFWGNLIIVAVIIPIAIMFIAYMEFIINVPKNILFDVKILFAFVFLDFFSQTGAPNWDCGTFITNRLTRKYFPGAILYIFRACFLVALFSIFVPKVWYVGLASLIVTVFGLCIGMLNTHHLTPELRISFGKNKVICSWHAIKELVGSGIWNSISNLGNMLLTGLDLLLCNLFIGPYEMGVLALGRVLPSYMQNFAATIFNAFAPELVINYAEGDKEKLTHDLLRAMKVLSFLLSIPLCGMIVLSRDFYSLWVPSEDATLLSNITILICSEFAFTSGTLILNSVFQTVNKVKANAMLVVASGAASTLTVFILLNTTELGIYAVAGVSVIFNLMRMNFYTIPYSSKYLNLNSKLFFRHEFICVLDTVLICVFCIGALSLIPYNNSWSWFIVKAIVVIAICIICNSFLLIRKEERQILFNKITRKKQSNSI